MSREIKFSIMRNFYLLCFFGLFTFYGSTQGLNIGFSTLASIAKVDANYQLNEKFDAGGFYGLGVKGLAPHYFGGSFKYQFQKIDNKKGTFTSYTGATLGFSYSQKYVVEELDLFTGQTTYSEFDAVKKFCGSAFIGGEKFIGRNEVFSTFSELHLGYMPNYLAYGLKGLLNALDGQGDTDPSKHAWWALQFGFRLHFGR
jgi:hypothetical protein